MFSFNIQATLLDFHFMLTTPEMCELMMKTFKNNDMPS